NGSVELHWRATPDDGMSPITGYRIYRSTIPGQEALFAELGTVNTWTDSNVTNGETYYYQLSALNAYGEGPRSGAVSAEPDGTPPMTSASLSGRLGNDGWWLSTVSVTLTASDDNSGVASTSFRVDGGAWATYAASFDVGEGEHTVDAYAIDVAGSSGPVDSRSFGVDTTPPITTAQVAGPTGENGWYLGAVQVTLAATDALGTPTIWV